jgi:PAS domain S-box-containing protein
MKKNRKVLRRNKSERIVRVTSESGRPQAGGGRNGRGRTSVRPSSNLSEREEAAQALRRSEERYRTLFDLVPAAVYACDADGIIREFNHRAAELWGRTPKTNGNVQNQNGSVEKFCGSYKIYYPDGRFMPHEKCPMARILRGEELDADELEIVVERENGERRNVIAAPRVLTNERGEITGAINCLYDITERKCAEEGLAEAARQQSMLYSFVQRRSRAQSLGEIYEAALHAILAALRCDRASILLFDEQRALRFVASRGLSKHYRKTVEEYLPWAPSAKKLQPVCISNVDLADFPKKLKRTIKAEGIRAAAFIPLLAKGKLIGKFATYYNTPHFFSEHETNVAMNIAGQLVHGIERKRAEEGLRESEARLRAIVDQATAGMARADLNGRILFVNQTFCDMLGYRESELLGKPIRDFTHPADAKKTTGLFSRLVKKLKPYEIEKRYVRKNGSIIWVNVSASPVYDVHGKTESAVAVDITAQKKAQAALQKSKELLEERVRERTAELRNANEELRKEIRRRHGLEGEILRVSDREQQRLGRQLHDSLCQHLTAVAFIARSVALRLKNHRVIESSDLDKIATLVNEAVSEARDIARDLHREDINAAELGQILRQLVDRRFWTTPCRIKMSTEPEIEDDEAASHVYRLMREAIINANKHARAKEIVLEVRRNKNEFVFSVIDDGVGIAPNGDSSGLGFEIMKYRANAIGGRLEIKTNKQSGTRVTCYLRVNK